MNFKIKRYLPAWMVFGVGLTLSVVAALEVKNDIDYEARLQLAAATDQVATKVSERLNSYALILNGAAGLFVGSEEVTRKEWKAYVEKLHADKAVPGIQGIGFSKLILPHEINNHVAHVRGEGFPGYAVRPEGERELYSAIIYLEPFRDRNLRAFGYDMLSEPVRRAALEAARDSGAATLTGKVELVQETSTEVQAGTLMFVPVYRNGAPQTTIAERRSALLGWTYSPYRMGDLMQGMLSAWLAQEGRGIVIHLFDGTEATPAQELFDSDPGRDRHSHTAPRSSDYQQRTIAFGGRQWLLTIDKLDGANGPNYGSAWATLFGTMLLSGLLCSLVFTLTARQEKAEEIAQTLTKDIAERSRELRESENQFRLLAESSPSGIWRTDPLGANTYVSARWSEITGIPREKAHGRGWNNGLHPDDRETIYQGWLAAANQPTRPYRSEFRFIHPSGRVVWVLCLAGAELNVQGELTGWIGTITDISDLKQTEDELAEANQRLLASEHQQRDLAQHDTMTGLANRLLFSDRLNQALVSAQRDQTRFALLYVDLDKFKPVNDSYGHHVGDELLKHVGQRLTDRVRESDTVARIGGDEFAILLRTIDSSDSVIVVAETIRDSLSQPFLIQNHLIEISCSIGIAIFPDHGDCEIELSRQADAAMYRAKESGRNIACMANDLQLVD